LPADERVFLLETAQVRALPLSGISGSVLLDILAIRARR
jgi:hypothetical protein